MYATEKVYCHMDMCTILCTAAVFLCIISFNRKPLIKSLNVLTTVFPQIRPSLDGVNQEVGVNDMYFNQYF